MNSGLMEIPNMKRWSDNVCVVDSEMCFLEAVQISAPPIREVAIGPL